MKLSVIEAQARHLDTCENFQMNLIADRSAKPWGGER